ncbi:MFS transporter [Rhodococcus erythropolis]|uniref:MFS transporter n=1 Tax=Rhodococcus erythropolis TaxID=1833 RepID=UPI002948E12D|nr:MFS transporter [Rhodococcus erythropolis]MDV6276799.1 MFS transporter [Rhodococcus erythropolis]
MSANSDETATSALAETDSVRTLPLAGLSALAMAGFIAITTETMPAGLLVQIGSGLSVSVSGAGQLVTAYALGSVVGAVPLIALTRGLRRRAVLVSAIVGFGVFNLVTALSSNFVLTLGVRLLAGMAAGVVWGLLAGYARRMAPPHLQGRAVAVASVGQPIALAIGVPMGAWLGTLVDWRVVFALMSGSALLLVVWILAVMPDFPGQQADRRLSVRKVLVLPGVRPILLVAFLWILAHNIVYTYLAAFLDRIGFGDRLGIVLFVFGLFAFVGIGVVGVFVDRALRSLTVLSLVVFAAALTALGVCGDNFAVIALSVAVWGVAFGGAPTLLQTALAETTGDAVDTAQSVFVTIFNSAIAAGGVAGGLVLANRGAGALPLVALVLIVVGVLAASIRQIGHSL